MHYPIVNSSVPEHTPRVSGAREPDERMIEPWRRSVLAGMEAGFHDVLGAGIPRAQLGVCGVRIGRV